MLAYFCKYVPEELLQAFGTELVCLGTACNEFHPGRCPDAPKYVFLLQSGSGRI